MSVAQNKHLTNKPEADGGALFTPPPFPPPPPPHSISASFYGNLELNKVTRKGKKSKRKSHLGVELETSHTEGRTPTNRANYSSCSWDARFLASQRPPRPSNVVAKKALISTHGTQNSTLFGVEGERSLVLLIPLEKVPMLLTSIVANRKQFKPQLSVACTFMSKTHRLASSVFCISHSVARFCFS